MKKILPLTSLVTVRPMVSKNPLDDWVLKDFADLFKYQKSCFSSCPTILETPVSYVASVTNAFFKFPYALRLAHGFWQQEQALTHHYRIGTLRSDPRRSQTESFTLDLLLRHFHFLDSKSTASIPENVKMSLWNERHRYLAIKDLKDINDFDDRKVAETLIQKAWCSQLLIKEEDWLKIDYLIKSNEAVILVADTDPLQIHYLMSQITERYPSLKWDIHSEVESTEVALPKKLSPTLYFASSYDYHSYTYEENNKKYNVETPTIIEGLIKQFGVNNLELISHEDIFPADLLNPENIEDKSNKKTV